MIMMNDLLIYYYSILRSVAEEDLFLFFLEKGAMLKSFHPEIYVLANSKFNLDFFIVYCANSRKRKKEIRNTLR